MTKPLPDHIKEFIKNEAHKVSVVAINRKTDAPVPRIALQAEIACNAVADYILSQADEKVEGEPEILCVAGCSAYSYNETYHHKDCGHYPETFSKMYDDLQQKVAGLEEKYREIDTYAKESMSARLTRSHEYGQLMTDALKLVEIIRMSTEINSNESLRKRSKRALVEWTAKHGEVEK